MPLIVHVRSVLTLAALAVLSVSLQAEPPSTQPSSQPAKARTQSKLPVPDDAETAFQLASKVLADGTRESNDYAYRLLSSAGKQSHAGALWKLLELSREGKAIKRERSKEISWLALLVEQKEIAAYKELRDASPATFVTRSRSLSQKFSFQSPEIAGAAVKFSARILPAIGETFVVRPIGHGVANDLDIVLDTAEVQGLQRVDGRVVSIAGYKTANGQLVALLAEVPEPKFTFNARVIPHAAVGCEDQVWDVDIVVRNEGKQPIKNVRLAVRCYQQQSPNDHTREVTVAAVGAGDSATLRTDFSMFNFQIIGKTSVPKCEIRLVGFDW